MKTQRLTRPLQIIIEQKANPGQPFHALSEITLTPSGFMPLGMTSERLNKEIYVEDQGISPH